MGKCPRDSTTSLTSAAAAGCENVKRRDGECGAGVHGSAAGVTGAPPPAMRPVTTAAAGGENVYRRPSDAEAEVPMKPSAGSSGVHGAGAVKLKPRGDGSGSAPGGTCTPGGGLNNHEEDSTWCDCCCGCCGCCCGWSCD
jgi:hypothetical protein